jgi:ABC-2 type transport system permease protein
MNRLATLTASEWRLFRREPMALFFTVAMPLLLLVILAQVPPFTRPEPNFGGLRLIDLYVPILIAMTICLLGLAGLPSALAAYRERGILRRLATTPMPARTLLGAQLLLNLGVATVVALALLLTGALAFDIALPARPLAYAASFGLATASMLALGLVLAALAPSARSATAIGTLLFYPFAFLAGLWFPRESMPDGLRAVSDLSPLGAGVQAMADAAAGSLPRLSDVVVMVVTIVLGGLVAARFFRWR